MSGTDARSHSKSNNGPSHTDVSPLTYTAEEVAEFEVPKVFGVIAAALTKAMRDTFTKANRPVDSSLQTLNDSDAASRSARNDESASAPQCQLTYSAFGDMEYYDFDRTRTDETPVLETPNATADNSKAEAAGVERNDSFAQLTLDAAQTFHSPVSSDDTNDPLFDAAATVGYVVDPISEL